MAGGHGGRRRGSGRPLDAKNLRDGTSAALIEATRIDENLIPVKFQSGVLSYDLRAHYSRFAHRRECDGGHIAAGFLRDGR